MAEFGLHEFPRRLSAQERADYLDGMNPFNAAPTAVVRKGSPVSVALVDDLMRVAAERQQDAWANARPESDRWLAPRLHYALRLSRRAASSQGLWLWLALRYPEYVEWRWAGRSSVTEDRWYGPVHKQAFARLWWGGELFHGDGDYGPVARAFVRQDLVNSFLHRPLVRCRPLALGVIDVLAPAGREQDVSSDDVNDLARVLNLATAGAPPEAETSYRREDVRACATWIDAPLAAPHDWDDMPPAPPSAVTRGSATASGASIAQRAWSYAHPATE